MRKRGLKSRVCGPASNVLRTADIDVHLCWSRSAKEKPLQQLSRRIPDLSDLTLRQKIGQMLCVGWGGDGCDGVNEHARFITQELQGGAIILMRRNVPVTDGGVDNAKLRATLAEMQVYSAVPVLFAMDQEGGRVQRLKGAPFTTFPTARAVGGTADREDSREIARLLARAIGNELRFAGIHWNFAPVADVDSNPNNPIIGDRAFSIDAVTVAQTVAKQVRGFADSGVLSCAKHFPGHGDTLQDSHFDLPILPHDLATMHTRELVPFRAAIAADVPTIMTAHILFPALDDSGLPATMSRAILTDLLRDEMGFRGVVVTDCLEMRAVADRWGTAKAALLAAKAGADMVMACHTRERQQETFDVLLGAAESGDLPIARVDEAVGRVLSAKRRAFYAASVVNENDVANFQTHRVLAQTIFGEADGTDAMTTLGESAPAKNG